MTDLEKYVVTYKGVDGGIVCNVAAYYDRFVVPLDGKFSGYSFENSRLVLCPLHDDHDPSLGMMRDKRLPDVMLYHCLGCGKVGTVVRLHQLIESLYHKRDISEKEACLELCKLFDIPEPEEGVDDDFEKRFDRRIAKIGRLEKAYSEKEFSRELLEIRRSGNVDLKKVNAACVKMIATKKGLYY